MLDCVKVVDGAVEILMVAKAGPAMGAVQSTCPTTGPALHHDDCLSLNEMTSSAMYFRRSSSIPLRCFEIRAFTQGCDSLSQLQRFAVISETGSKYCNNLLPYAVTASQYSFSSP